MVAKVRYAAVAAISGVALAATAALVAAAMATRERPATSQPVTARDRSVLQAAEQVLTGRCMRRQGFRYWAAPADPIADDRRFPYVVDDAAWAARHGYGSDLDNLRDHARAGDPNQRYLDSLPADRRQAYSVALNGNGPGDPGVTIRLPSGVVEGESVRGCTATAERELYSDLKGWFTSHTLLTALPETVRNRVMNDPAYGEATARWADCMRAAGFPYPSPAAAAAAFSRPSPPAPSTPGDLEIRTAVAEAHCAATTGLAGTAHRLDGSYLQRLRAGYRRAVATEQRLARRALPRARALTSTGKEQE